LRQVDPAVEERSQREFSRLGQTRSAGHNRGDDGTKHDRAAVGAELDNVLAGVRMRGREVSGDDLIDGRWFRLQLDERIRRAPRFQRTRTREQAAGDVLRARAAQPNDPDAAPAGRRCDGDDGVARGESQSGLLS
jgi:hypothetical protein